jgi:multiple sugar transport system substrate-binding protein
MLQDMRFKDSSMTKTQLYNQDNTLQLLASGKIAMAVMAPDSLTNFKYQLKANLDDFGIGGMPQNGGNASLTGGNVFIFNPKSAKNVVKAAFDYVLYSNFNLDVLETQYKGAETAQRIVGGPTNIVFVGDFQKQLTDLANKYKNVPVENYLPYINAGLNLRAEPRNQTQKMYGLIDSAMQAVLTNANADPKTLLDDAAKQFQTILDQSAS